MWTSLLLAAALLIPSAPRLGERPASARQIAEARATADQILVDSGAADLFDNVTDTATPTLRHRGSGMICAFSGRGRQNYVRVAASSPSAPLRGDNIACGTQLGSIEISVSATRYSGHPAQEAVFRSAMAAVRADAPGARPYQGFLPSVRVDGSPPVQSGGFTMTLARREVTVLVFVAQSGE